MLRANLASPTGVVYLVLLVLACYPAGGAAVAPPHEEDVLIGLDYGSEWIEIAVAQGADIDIVLNENTQRKSLAALSFPDAKDGAEGLRLFGEAAMSRPHAALQYLRELLGERSPYVLPATPHRWCMWILSFSAMPFHAVLHAFLLQFPLPEVL